MEFAREPAGGGCGREWCFPVQCMVVARICQAVSHGIAVHAACEVLPSAVEWTPLSSYSPGLAERADGALSPGGVTFQYPPPCGMTLTHLVYAVPGNDNCGGSPIQFMELSRRSALCG